MPRGWWLVQYLFPEPMYLSRRDLLRRAIGAAAALALPAPLGACARSDQSRASNIAQSGAVDTLMAADAGSPEDLARLRRWSLALREDGFATSSAPLGGAAARVGEEAVGTPYEAFTLEAYLRAGGSPMRTEPLILSLTRFDCVSLVESCLAVARVAEQPGTPAWNAYAREMERMRYRGGVREGYVSRLHYFSEWISDGAERGLVRDLGAELGGTPDRRPLRFMTEHRQSYPALADPDAFRLIGEMERRLDAAPRLVIGSAQIPDIADRIETGDILAFATSIAGLDVTHSAFAYRDDGGVLRVLHAPLSGGAVEVTRTTLPEYVAGIRGSTGILVARPLRS